MAVRDERGMSVKAILALVVIAYLVFMGIKLIPAVSDDKAFEKKTEEVIKYAGVNRDDANQVRYKLNQEAKRLGLPFKEEDIKVAEEGKEWHVTIAYDRVVPLIVWTYQKPIRIDKRAVKE